MTIEQLDIMKKLRQENDQLKTELNVAIEIISALREEIPEVGKILIELKKFAEKDRRNT